eukprot:scaffold3378_cov104-Cylindrotheca_fusiformis.AAC.5
MLSRALNERVVVVGGSADDERCFRQDFIVALVSFKFASIGCYVRKDYRSTFALMRSSSDGHAFPSTHSCERGVHPEKRKIQRTPGRVSTELEKLNGNQQGAPVFKTKRSSVTARRTRQAGTNQEYVLAFVIGCLKKLRLIKTFKALRHHTKRSQACKVLHTVHHVKAGLEQLFHPDFCCNDLALRHRHPALATSFKAWPTEIEMNSKESYQSSRSYGSKLNLHDPPTLVLILLQRPKLRNKEKSLLTATLIYGCAVKQSTQLLKGTGNLTSIFSETIYTFLLSTDLENE